MVKTVNKIKILWRQNHSDRKQRTDCNWAQRNCLDDGNVLYPNGHMVLRFNIFVKAYKNVHLNHWILLLRNYISIRHSKNCNKLCNFNVISIKIFETFNFLNLYIYMSIYIYLYTSIQFKKHIWQIKMSMYIYMHVRI